MCEYCLYKHTSPHGKVYIGITKTVPQYRWGVGGSGYSYNRHFWAAIQKYGWDNFKHTIIATGLDPAVAAIFESQLIRKYNATNPQYGYNQLPGPCYPTEMNPDLKRRQSLALSKALKGRVFSETHKANLRQARRRVVESNDYCWVSRGSQATIINKRLLDDYINDGWSLGRVPSQTVYVHRGTENRRIPITNLKEATESGWCLGKSLELANNIKRSRQQYVWMCDNQTFSTAADLAAYLRATHFPNIVASTLTAAFNGQVFKKYPNLLDIISRKPVEGRNTECE